MRSKRGLFSDDPVQNELLRWEADCFSPDDIAASYARLHPTERQRVMEVEAVLRQFVDDFSRRFYEMRTREFWGRRLLERLIMEIEDMEDMLTRALSEEGRRARSH